MVNRQARTEDRSRAFLNLKQRATYLLRGGGDLRVKIGNMGKENELCL